MGKARGGNVSFDPERIVMGGGATGANEMIMFCLADPGDAFLVPTPYYPGYVRYMQILNRLSSTKDRLFIFRLCVASSNYPRH